MIAFLHTSSIHIQKFTDLVRKYSPTIETEHFVDESLLKTAMQTGKIDELNFAKTVQSIQGKSPDMIICTCSTYGEACETLTGIERIDMPIARYLVSNFSKIILAYTAISTRDVSRCLLESVAEKIGKNIEIVESDCTSSWQYFLENDMENYHKEIFGKVTDIYVKGSAIFLAQASMEGARKYFVDEKIEVFSSAEFGVREYLKELKN